MLYSLPRELTCMILSHLTRDTLLQLSITCKSNFLLVEQHFTQWARRLIKEDTYFHSLSEETVLRYLKRAHLELVIKDSCATKNNTHLYYTNLIPPCSDVPKFVTGNIVKCVDGVCIDGLESFTSSITGQLPDVIQVENSSDQYYCLTKDHRVLVYVQGTWKEQPGRYNKIIKNCALTVTGQLIELRSRHKELPPWKNALKSLPLMLDFDRTLMDTGTYQSPVAYNLSYITLDHQAIQFIVGYGEIKLLDNASKIFCIDDATFVLTHDGKFHYFDYNPSKNEILLEDVIDVLRKRPMFSGANVTLCAITKDHQVIYSYEGYELTSEIVPRLSDKLWLDDESELIVSYA